MKGNGRICYPSSRPKRCQTRFWPNRLTQVSVSSECLFNFQHGLLGRGPEDYVEALRMSPHLNVATAGCQKQQQNASAALRASWTGVTGVRKAIMKHAPTPPLLLHPVCVLKVCCQSSVRKPRNFVTQGKLGEALQPANHPGLSKRACHISSTQLDKWRPCGATLCDSGGVFSKAE